ncbi:MAG: gamma carbonic anhydrase family protein [Candidatus Baldrarchaeia archaeon]
MIVPYKNKSPDIKRALFVAPNATLLGEVKLMSGVSVWFGSILKGDSKEVYVNENSAILENCFVEGSNIGKETLISHGAILHSCSIGDNVLVGIGAIILDNAKIGDNSIVAAGSVVPPKTKIDEGTVVAGMPAKVVREIREGDIINLKNSLKTIREKALVYYKMLRT